MLTQTLHLHCIDSVGQLVLEFPALRSSAHQAAHFGPTDVAKICLLPKKGGTLTMQRGSKQFRVQGPSRGEDQQEAGTEHKGGPEHQEKEELATLSCGQQDTNKGRLGAKKGPFVNSSPADAPGSYNMPQTVTTSGPAEGPQEVRRGGAPAPTPQAMISSID